MKKPNNNWKFALIKIVAVVTIFQSSVNFSNDNKEENVIEHSYSRIDIDNFVNKIILSMNYTPASIRLDKSNSIVLDLKDSKSYIRIVGNRVLIDTEYKDGFYEKRVLNLSGFEDSSFMRLEKGFSYESKEYVNSDFYDRDGNITNLGKEHVIMDAFKISQDELDFVLAGPMAEGIEDNYRDVSAAMRTGINRFFSYAWVGHAIDRLELECNYDEVTIYDVFRDSWQFAVYYSVNGKEPRYEQFLGLKSGEGYQGALDTLYYSIFEDNIPDELIDKIVVHDYLEFQDKNDPIPGGYTYEQFVEGGNKHYRHQKEYDRISIIDSMLSQYYEENMENEYTLELK